MKKVLIWGATDTVGGVEIVLWNYVSNIHPSIIQFDFINTYKEISIGSQVIKLGSQVISLPNRRSSLLNYKRAINKFMRIHAHEYDAVWLNDCMFGNIDILKLAKKYHIPTRIIHAHNSLNMGGGKSRLLRHKINSYLLKFYVTDYWACSKLAGLWSYPKSIQKSGVLKIIPNAIETKRFSFNNKVRIQYREDLGVSNKVVFGHVGRFHFQKNHMFLIDIFSEILKIIPNTVLWLVGNGEDEEKIKVRIEEYGISEFVTFMGIREDVPDLLQAMDAFILPSFFEGLPVVLVEAQAAGLPCFVSDNITKESDITKNVEYYSLNLTKKDWANRIAAYMKIFERKDVTDLISKNGYSIVEAAKQVEKEFYKG